MPDTWTALQFDSVVTYFGRRIEAMLNELDDKGKTKHKLEDLLEEGTPVGILPTKKTFQSMKMQGIVGKTRKIKAKSEA